MLAAEAKARGVTRALVSMEKAAKLGEPLIFAIGNAPTALIRLAEMIDEGRIGKLLAVNALGDMMIASRQGDFPVAAGDRLAGTRVIPLVIEKEKMERAKAVAAGGLIFRVLPFTPKKVGIVTTGNEVFHGRITDKFTPVIVDKVSEYGGTVIGHELSDDDHERIAGCIHRMLDMGAELVV